MELTAQNVTELTKACLLAAGEPLDAAVIVEGITRKFAFDRARINRNASPIALMLADLPEPFHAGSGDGWSFLNACNDRNGRQWTDLHATMEALFCLGIAAGKARWLMPRDMWDIFPGGMPYVAVNADGSARRKPTKP